MSKMTSVSRFTTRIVARHDFFVVQWSERPTGMRKVIVSNPVRIVSDCPTLVTS